MTPQEQIATRDREMDLLLLAEHTRTSLYTWTLPADFGIDHGIKQGGKFHRTYMSDGEILQGVLEWKPQPDFDNGEEFPEEIREYARQLWAELGDFIRTRCTFVTAQGGGPRCYDSL